MFACGIRNPGLLNRKQLKKSGIPLTIEMKNPLTKTGIQYLESGMHGVESIIQALSDSQQMRQQMICFATQKESRFVQTESTNLACGPLL